jgi:tRNA modification GTPase
VLWFPAPASFTGENVAELHLHGGPAVMEGVASALGNLPGFRPAEAGEFTRRAFRNGKMDLAETEGLSDLIDADTPIARKRALWQLDGGLSAIHSDWRTRLTKILAFAEATLDFSDEPLPADLEAGVNAEISGLSAEISRHLASSPVTERLKDGFRVALVGAPNAGKSSLLNALAGRDAAIVSDIPGTTRDILEVRLDLSGYPVLLLDTAGIRESQDPIEQEGMRRAEAAAESADLIVEVKDATAVEDEPVHEQAGRLFFWNKADLLVSSPVSHGLAGSATTGLGLALLEQALTAAAKTAIESNPTPAITRARHRVALSDAHLALEQALLAPLPELAAEDLRTALRALGRVVGIVDVEDVLDQIFSAFCIGK